MTLQAPFRFDIVGSFLRPDRIKEARDRFARGEIAALDLKQVEDEEIARLIEKQKAAGLHTITDGEFRRSYWHLDFFWGFQGITHIELEHGYQFHGEETTRGTAIVTGKIGGENHPFVEHFKYVKGFEDDDTLARQTMPAPAQLLAELYRGDNGKITDAVYPDREELLQDIATAYRQVIRDLYHAGCRNIQFDDCTWGMFCDTEYWNKRQKGAVSLKAIAEDYLRLNNMALEGRPKDLVITTHVCRGNYHSTWAARGGYGPIAPLLFGRENVDAFYLEFDDERSGSFEPLKEVVPGKKVAGTGRPGTGHRPDPGSGPVCSPGKPLPQSSVRFCLLRNRQQADGRTAMGQTGSGPFHCPGGLGRIRVRELRISSLLTSFSFPSMIYTSITSKLI